MRYVEVGGVRVSAIGLGAWQFGSREWGYGDDYARREAGAIVRRALDLGIDLIDTAEAYGMGRSERIVGRAIRDRRDAVFLATKLLPLFPLPSVALRHARASVGRLGVGSVELYQLHWPNPAFPPGVQVEGLRRVLDAGLARHVGVSNYSLTRWRRAEGHLGRPILSNQVRFNLAERAPMRELVPYAQRTGRIVIAYSPLAQGLLSGRYDERHRPSNGIRRGNVLFAPENLRAAAGVLDALREVAASHDATPAQVALAWLIHLPNVVAIPGASSVAQLEQNAAAADLALTDDECGFLLRTAEAFRPETGIGARVRGMLGR
jgi:aryl-alcohol dehydrogenase-like predicted oxidoreductase